MFLIQYNAFKQFISTIFCTNQSNCFLVILYFVGLKPNLFTSWKFQVFKITDIWLISFNYYLNYNYILKYERDKIMQTEERITKLYKYLKERKRIKLNGIDNTSDIIKSIDDNAITCLVDILEWILADENKQYMDVEGWE